MKIFVDHQRKIFHAVSVMNLLPQAQHLRNVSEYNNSEIGYIHGLLNKASDDGLFSVKIDRELTEETISVLTSSGYKLKKLKPINEFRSGQISQSFIISW